MTRRNNVAKRESNDIIDHKKMVITWISFSDEVKHFFLIECIKEGNVLTFLILGPILDHIFGPKKDKLFCPVFVFRRSMSNAICDLVLYLQSGGLSISWIYPVTIPLQYLKMVLAIQYSTLSLTGSQFIFLKWDGLIWDLGGKVRQKRIHLFWAFWSSSFKFLFKRWNHEELP